MSGKMRLATKLFLATALLAGMSAATWVVMAGGWHALVARVGGAADVRAPEQSIEGDAIPLAAADLDAVASAWVEPVRSQPPVESSATARTAVAARDEADTLAELPELDERYPFAAEHTAAVQNTAGGAEEPEPEAEPALAIVAEPAVLTALARGQEPNDEATPRPTRRQFDDDLAELTEPQPLHATGQERRIGSAPQNYQDAFQNQPASATGDRYTHAAPTGGELEEAPGAARGGNPFAATGRNPSAERDIEELDPLPAMPHELDHTVLGRAENRDEPRPLRDDRSARATRGEPIDDYRGGEGMNSLEGGFVPQRTNQNADSRPRTNDTEGTGRPGERALEGPQRPALEIQKFAPAEIQVGKPAKFLVQVRNVGNQAADGVTVRDEVPQGTRLISTSPTAQHDGHQLVWQLGKLSPGEDRTVEMQLMPTGEGEVGSVATVSYSAQASVKTRCTMPQLAIRMTAPSKVLVGQEQRVKIELRNPGSGDATGVMLFENVPQNLRHAAGPALEFEIGTLRAGETRELELVLHAEKAGRTVNVLTARADGNLQVQQQVEFDVIAPALAVDIDGPERRYLERPATYEVSVENPGTAPAHHVQIVTKLPKGLRFVRANNLGEYDAATHAVYWSLAELPEGERGTVELVAMPIEIGPQTLHVEGRAPAQGLADQVQRQIVIEGLAAIRFEVRDLEDPIEVGGETAYEIRVVNQGTKAATNVQVSLTLPPGMKYVSAEGETQHVTERDVVRFEPIAQLAPKADTLYRVRVQAAHAGDQRVTVEVHTDDLAQPIRREESTRVFGDE